MRLYAFHCGGELSMRSLFDPNDPDCGAPMMVPYFFFLIQHAGENILFDTGMHPLSISDPAAHFGEHVDAYPIRMAPGDDAVSLLETVGIAPSDVGHIVQSHLHYDHAGGLTLFERATVHLNRAELPFALWPPVYQRNPPQFIRHEFESVTRWHEIEGDCDILGDGRLIAFPTPGHTAGHQSLLVASRQRAGDPRRRRRIRPRQDAPAGVAVGAVEPRRDGGQLGATRGTRAESRRDADDQPRNRVRDGAQAGAGGLVRVGR